MRKDRYELVFQFGCTHLSRDSIEHLREKKKLFNK